ncbi:MULTISPECIES: transposase [unclassified Streptomyces]|uniref:transposase n=1 Tax=unclassified Streptomyces TaxID=2593676 RepID=UPI0007C7F7D3|nr:MULTISPECIES: transposase [unclassified Streptomyces]
MRNSGRKRHPDRLLFQGIVFTFRTGPSGRNLPERSGPWRTVPGRFARWAADGTFDRLLAVARSRVQAGRLVGIYSTIVRSSRHTAATEGSKDAVSAAPAVGRPASSTSPATVRACLRRRVIKTAVPERVDQLQGRGRRRKRYCESDKAVYRRPAAVTPDGTLIRLDT